MTRSAEDLQDALRHEGALRRLAAALGTRGLDADEAAQHALAQEALGRRPRGAPLLPFLCATVRNHVRNVQKLAARRRRHEGRALPRPRPEPADAWWAREQLRREVANAVLALPEPYRTAVWLRWFEDLDVAAVAARTGVPAATVRTRLARAHARLRERLDAAYGERDWALLAMPLAPSVSSAGGGVAFVLGGLLVNKVLAVGAVVVLAALLWWWQERAAPVPEPAAPVAAADAPRARDAGVSTSPPVRVAVEPSAPVPEAATDAPRAAVVPDPTPAQLEAVAGLADAGCLEGVVLDGRGPLAGGTAWLRSVDAGGLPWGTADDWDAAPGALRESIDAAGRFRFCGLAPGGYALGVRTAAGATRHVYVELPAGESRAARVRFPFGGASLHGVVRDGDAQLATRWHVAVFNPASTLGGAQTILAATTDANGEFTLAGLCAGHWYIQASPTANFRNPHAQAITVVVAPGEAARVQVGPSPDSCEWSGRVLLPGGTPIAALAKTDLEVASTRGTTMLAIAADGSFRGRVDPGSPSLSILIATGVRVRLGDVAVPPGRSGPWLHDLVLPDGVLRVRATFVAAEAPKHARTAWQTRVTFAAGGNALGVRAADGCDYYFGVPPGTHRIVAWPHPIAGAPAGGTTFTMPAVREQDLDLVLQER